MVIMYVTKRTIIATVIVVFTTISVTQAHVALTFPPARKYDLDFLDNSRTKGPCGMPKGSVKTSLLSGSTFNVTWHLAYPHRGGFKLQVLDNLSRPVLDLTPVTADSEFVRTDAVAQMYTVHLPQDFECPDCTIRLQREAIEWGSSYRFWSCGDVDIKNRKMYKEDCSGHGRYLLSKCRCDRLYYGSRCQYRDECIDNSDCGDRGRCVDIQATTAPRKQCYCEIGWFGPACTKRSPIKSVDIDLTGHNHRELATGLQMYWRILREEKEIEVAIVSNGTSYIGIGWRPRNLTAACKNFPPLEDPTGSPEYHEPKIIPKSEPEPSSEPEPKSEPEPSSVPEPSSEPEPNSKPETTNKSKPKTKPEPQSEPEPSSVPEPSSEPEPKSEPEPTSNLHKAGRAVSSRDTTNHKTPDTNDHPEVSVETSISFRVSSSQGNRGKRAAMEDETVAGKPESAPEPISEPEPKSESEPKAEPEPTSEPETKSKPELKSEPEPKSEPVPDIENDLKIQADPKLKPEASLLLPYTPRHDFNGMDCTDIVIGMARGTSHRIWDYYTRDRSTPRLDTFWGGKNDITAAMGFEKDGVTTIVFRKKLKATEPTDHSIEEDLMHLIWARGQESGRYIHFPKSGLEKDFVSVKDFYKPDELKYHGHGDMRGVTTINFYEEIPVTNNAAPGSNEVPQVPKITTCKGEWSYPRGCDPAKKKCEYHAAWEYLPRKDEIKFTILTNNTNTWTGIGFSDDHRMSQTDAVLGWVDKSGRPFLMDTWIGGYTSPLLDQSQDIYNTTGRINDGLTTLSFVRRRSTTDAKDLSFTDEKCLYLMFPVKGGPFNAVNKKIRKHASVPIVTSQRVCIKSCGDGPEPSTTPAPPRLAYNVEVKLIKLGQNFQAPDVGTPDFDILSNTVNAGFTRALTKLPGFHKVSVTEFKQDQDNVIAKMNLELDKAQLERGRSLEDSQTSVEQVLQETVAAGRVGALTLDPAYLVFEPHQLTSNVPTDDAEDNHSLLLSATKLWIVIGCIIALVIVAIVQAGCTIYRTMKHPVPHHKDNLIPNSAWKDYSAANTNYAFEAFESEEKQPGSIAHTNGSSRSTMPLTTKSMTMQHGHPPSNAQHGYTPHGNGSSHYADTRSLQRPRGYGGSHERSTYSLPRSANQPPPPHHNGYYTHRPPRPHSDQLQPDFYFMPSQRKYSGEVVRVYVDYNSPRK